VTNLTVNDNGVGVWASSVGEVLEYVGPGANSKHVRVVRPGERKSFCLPVTWLDGLETEGNHNPEPQVETQEVCPRCGQPIIKEKAT
jgi:hypothetical protein